MIAKKKFLGILCLLMTAGFLFVGLWPFDPSPKNRAYWIPDEKGLHFDGQNRRFKLSVGGIAYTPSPLSSTKPLLSEKGSFTIDIVLKPAVVINSGVPHIIGFVDSAGKEAFYLGQWKQSLIMRWFTYDEGGRRWRKEIGVRDALIKDKTQRLTLVADLTTCSIYVNGELVKTFQDVSLIGEKESMRGCSVTLGNSMNVKGPWTGSVIALKVYERMLSESEIARDWDWATESASGQGLMAAFEMGRSHSTSIPDLSDNRNTLAVPERITLTNNILDWPDWKNQKDSSPAGDIAVNILGFMPFGFLFAFWREQVNGSKRWRSILLVVLVGAMISLVIEMTQAFVPARDSNMVDLICNTAGAAIGGLTLALFVRLRTEKPKEGYAGSNNSSYRPTTTTTTSSRSKLS